MPYDGEEENADEEATESEMAHFLVIEADGLIPLKKYKKGRLCQCGAKLSVYNAAEKCWPCQEKSKKAKF